MSGVVLLLAAQANRREAGCFEPAFTTAETFKDSAIQLTTESAACAYFVRAYIYRKHVLAFITLPHTVLGGSFVFASDQPMAALHFCHISRAFRSLSNSLY